MTTTRTTTRKPSAPRSDKDKVLHRLRRLEGQVRGLAGMIEADRPCLEVLTLLAGIRSAVDAVGDLVLEEYIAECQAENTLEAQTVVQAVRLARR